MKKCILFLSILLFAGCASFRSGIEGRFEGKVEKNFGAEKVKVLFIFDHYHQAKGYDAIPKLENNYQIIKEFDDLFIDALKELSNVGSYNTYTEYSSDVANPKRRAEKDSLIAIHDFIFRIKFMREHSFAKHFLGVLVSTVSATLVPLPYGRQYLVTVEVYNAKDILIKSYSRRASFTKWVQSLLIVVYPFHTEKRKVEEIYIQFLHDIFRQIESEKVLDKNLAISSP
jgi:hypothetical protein